MNSHLLQGLPVDVAQTATNCVLVAALVFEILSIPTVKIMNNELVPRTLKEPRMVKGLLWH